MLTYLKKIFYHYYKLLSKNGFIFVDDICWLPYAKSSYRESSGMYDANYKVFEKLLEIKFNNRENFNIDFSFNDSGTAKITKITEAKIKEPKKVKKSFFHFLYKPNFAYHLISLPTFQVLLRTLI